MPDPNTRVAALLSGQDRLGLRRRRPNTVPRLKQQGMQVVSNVYPHVWPIWLSYTPDSPFLDIRVRKAAKPRHRPRGAFANSSAASPSRHVGKST